MRKRKIRPADKKTPVTMKSKSFAKLPADGCLDEQRKVFGGIYQCFAKNQVYFKFKSILTYVKHLDYVDHALFYSYMFFFDVFVIEGST
jgi:hypothetical protein